MKMERMSFLGELFAVCSLGLLCGWYYFLLLLLPVLIASILCYKSVIASIILGFLVLVTLIPIKHEPWTGFMYSPIFKIWRDYFNFTYDCSSITGKNLLDVNEKYMFFEFPHGIFPMGQFLSASVIDDIGVGMICGTAADVVFRFPIMRHIMAWLGTHPVSSKNIKKVLDKYKRCAIIPGGIAEMYLVNDESEKIFLKSRHNTIKNAIINGAHIIPAVFFGNSSIFNVVRLPTFVERISRRLKASLVLFTGRFWLSIPFRKPLKMVSGRVVKVTKNDNPTNEEVEKVMQDVIASLNEVWAKKPEWETRPLIIT
jgi:2-acylglycerol O-acyltransferase 2